MHFSSASSSHLAPSRPASSRPVSSRLAALMLTAALAGSATFGAAQAQSLTETSAAAAGQSTLNSVGTPNPAAVIQKAKQVGALVNPQQAQDAASTATTTAPAIVITPLTAAQQTALAAAQASYTAKNYAQARKQYEALIAQNFNNPEPHFGLALTLLAQKDDKGAIFELGQFRAMAPDRYEGPYNLGVIATRAGRYEDALKFYTDAAALAKGKAPANVQAQILGALSGEQSRKGDFAGLVTTMTDLAALRPDDQNIQFQLAQAQAFSGNGAAALPGLYALIQAAPQRADAVNLLADVYVSQGLPDRALREIEAALPRVGTAQARGSLLLHKANILAAQGDTRSAVFSAQAAHVQDPSNIEAFVREADLRLQRNDRAGALALYQSAVKLDPQNVKLRTDLAALRLKLGQTDQAGQDAAQVLKMSPDVATLARAQFIQGVALYRAGQYAQARPLLNSSALAVRSADTTLWLGLANYALKDYAGAIAALSESVKISPTAAARQNLASALLAAGRYAEAEAVLRGMVTDSPKNGDAWYLLGLAQRGQLRPDDAKLSFKTASALGNVSARDALK